MQDVIGYANRVCMKRNSKIRTKIRTTKNSHDVLLRNNEFATDRTSGGICRIERNKIIFRHGASRHGYELSKDWVLNVDREIKAWW
jgi:hypothetical protein